MGTSLTFLPTLLFLKCHLIHVMWLQTHYLENVFLISFHLLVHRRLNVRVNIELLSMSNPVHKKVSGLVIFVSFIRYYLNLIV